MNLFDTNGATFYITGIQLERGSVATDFEHRSFGQELALCERYFFTNPNAYFSSVAAIQFQFATTMRAAPTVTYNHAGSVSISNINTRGFTGYNAQNNTAPYFANAEL